MTKSPNWPARDQELRNLHAQGLSWGAIAERMGLSRLTVCSHGRRIGLDNSHMIQAPTTTHPKRVGKVSLPQLPSLVGHFDHA